MALTKTEIAYRRRLVRSGEWSEVWITTATGEQFFAKRCTLINDWIVRFVKSDNSVIDVELEDIRKAVH